LQFHILMAMKTPIGLSIERKKNWRTKLDQQQWRFEKLQVISSLAFLAFTDTNPATINWKSATGWPNLFGTKASQLKPPRKVAKSPLKISVLAESPQERSLETKAPSAYLRNQDFNMK